MIGSINAPSDPGAPTAPSIPHLALEQLLLGIPSLCEQTSLFLWDLSNAVKGFVKPVLRLVIGSAGKCPDMLGALKCKTFLRKFLRRKAVHWLPITDLALHLFTADGSHHSF